VRVKVRSLREVNRPGGLAHKTAGKRAEAFAKMTLPQGYRETLEVNRQKGLLQNAVDPDNIQAFTITAPPLEAIFSRGEAALTFFK
jgi:hypothetical protein